MAQADEPAPAPQGHDDTVRLLPTVGLDRPRRALRRRRRSGQPGGGRRRLLRTVATADG